MTKANDFALIIGIHDYRTYDPTGRSNVAGALQDARTWVQQCLRMGFAPANIRVLTSPVLSEEDLGLAGKSIVRGEATRDGILEGLGWLMKSLGGEAPAVGLMTYSGHAEESDGRLLLCPTDTTNSLDNVIDVLQLRRDMGNEKAAQSLTMLIDGCHGQVGLDRQQSIRARLQAKLESIPVQEGIGVAERVIAACKKDQESVSSHFDGKRMGAFTWAMTSALGQWRMARENGVLRSTVAYGELVKRCRALLSALSFEQEPVLSGPEGVAKLAFLHPGNDEHAGETSDMPNGRRPGRQLDAGSKGYRVYEISWRYNNRTLVLAEILVANTTNGDYVAGTEYWYVSPANIDSVEKEGTIRVTLTQDQSWTTPFTAPPGATLYETSESISSGWTEAQGATRDVWYADVNGDDYGLQLWKGASPYTSWYGPSNSGNWYFTSDDAVGTSISLTFSASVQFGYYGQSYYV